MCKERLDFETAFPKIKERWEEYGYSGNKNGEYGSLAIPVGDGLFAYVFSPDKVGDLIIQYDKDKSAVILVGTTDRTWVDDAMYCSCPDGYAIVYPESNICKVYLHPLAKASYSAVSDEGTNGAVIYLDSFEEFTPYEQKVLDGLGK